MSAKNDILAAAIAAKKASVVLAGISSAEKNRAIRLMAKRMSDNTAFILRENKKDIAAARREKLNSSVIDRLILDRERIRGMVSSLEAVAALDDVVGTISRMKKRPNGLFIGRMRVPIGVIGIIYEARPNVTSDCVGLCLKSGNSVILRGGSAALNSNLAIFKCLKDAASKTSIPEGAIAMISSKDRNAVKELLKLSKYIDLIMPRGGEDLIKEVTENSRIPVIKHYKGVCHVYVDEDADLNAAHKIAFNAKVQRPAVCNAMETLLVHEAAAQRFLPVLAAELKKAGVELRGCKKTRAVLKGIKSAVEEDWYAEYLDLILSIKIVSNIDEAIDHINTYGSSHSDAIVTENYDNAMKFLRRVDSACVYVNASTRFTDGCEFGMGAEIGISTDKLHARGPMGLEELTTYKYIILGSGQIRE